MEIKYECPFGNKCEEIKNNELHRCKMYIEVAGLHPQTGESVSQWDCAFNWIVVVQMENSKQLRGVAAATESLRNEFTKATVFNMQSLQDLVITSKLLESKG